MLDAVRADLAPAERAALAQKLEVWAAEHLTGRERAYLEQMLEDAADAANESASGYANVASALRESDEVTGYADGLTGTIAGSLGSYADALVREEVEYAEDVQAIDPE